MRQAGPAPQHVQRRQTASDVSHLFIVRQTREVNDHAAVRIAKRAQQLAWRRRSIFASEHGHAGQAFERAVVAFRIDGAHAIAVQNQLLAEQTRDPRFSGFRRRRSPGRCGRGRRARIRDRPPGTRAADDVGRAAESGRLPGCGELSHIVGDGRRPGAGERRRRRPPATPCCPTRPRRPLPPAAGARDRSRRRRSRRCCARTAAASRAPTCSPVALLTPCGSGHHAAAVEDEHQRQFERANDLQQPRRLVGVRIDQALSRGEGNAATAQFGDEALRAPAAPAPTSVRCRESG